MIPPLNTDCVHRLPLSWYTDLIQRREPFTFLTYGDGEFLVMAGDRTGERFTHYRERVTDRLVGELRASLDAEGADIIRGTDPHLLEPWTYQGQDRDAIESVAARVKNVLGGRQLAWVDGVVWDTASRTPGGLAPLFQSLRGRSVCLVGNDKLRPLAEDLQLHQFASVPDTDAASVTDLTEFFVRNLPGGVYLLCCGLSAIPLALRLRQRVPDGTFIDLGSALDMMVGLGAERGWRSDLYADPKAWREAVARNLET